jgi:flagellar biogenesis protein FliO
LVVLERVNLAPHQSLALVEADGRRLLVGTSPDAALSFYSLDGTETPAAPLRSNAIEIRGHVC